jgi:hypothetical protein
MADEEVDETEALIQELLDAGFTYSENGRVEGLAKDEGQEDDPGLTEKDEDFGLSRPYGSMGTNSVSDGDGVADGDDNGTGTEPPSAAAEQGDLGSAPDEADFFGTRLTKTEAEGLLRVRQLLMEHPDLASSFNEMVTNKLSGKAQPGEVEEPGELVEEKLPDFIDPDDIQAVAFWTELNKLRSDQEKDRRVQQEVMSQADQARVTNDINTAVEKFRTSHPDLTEEDIQTVRNYTSANVNIPGVMSNFPGDPVEGLVRSLELGSLTDPATRDKVLGVRKEDTKAKDRVRQNDLTKLSGGTGTSTRRPQREKPASTWNEVATRLAKELESMGGTT